MKLNILIINCNLGKDFDAYKKGIHKNVYAFLNSNNFATYT
ncbi:hypothetical protein SAMN02910355_1083 [Terrisporobacter glycolicus]|nr:hypothetical protein SAMN02910355_1083 [Terrisporobacter glycolicus]